MFVAANRHPALLTYLDQDQSRKDAVNENLARENLELYTVGVDGGYTELDVRQAALLQTGRSVSNDKYVYRKEFALRRSGEDHGVHPPQRDRRRRRGGLGGLLPLPRDAPVDGPLHRPEPGHPARLGHPAGRPDRRGSPTRTWPTMARSRRR